MDETSEEDGRRLHIKLRKHDLAVLDAFCRKFGLSRSAAIRTCIRSAALNIESHKFRVESE